MSEVSHTKKDIEALGKTIREFRKRVKEYGDSGEAFALAHHFARAQWNRYENGQDIRFSTLLRILEALDVSAEEFWAAWRDHREK